MGATKSATQAGAAQADRAMTELRMVEQRVALMQPGKIHTPDSLVDCEILLLSREGARVRVLGDLQGATDLFLAVRGFGQLACRLGQVDGDCVELNFCGDAESQDATFQDILDRFGDEEGQRHFLRRSVLWPGQLVANGESHSCTILNMSLGGAKVALCNEGALSDHVTLEGDRFQGLKATVSWTSGRVVGLEFKDEPAAVARALGDILPTIKAPA